MWKDDLNVHIFQYKNWCSPKSDWWFFFYPWLSEDLSIRRILGEKKKYEGMGLISEKTEVLYIELNERAEAATSSYSGTGNSLYTAYLFCACV